MNGVADPGGLSKQKPIDFFKEIILDLRFYVLYPAKRR